MNGETFSGEFAFSQPVINIGSDAGNDIVLIGSSVGTFHAMMHYDSNRWFVASLDPEKRTFVNGHTIDANGASLQSGSVLTIGDYRMTVRLNGINTDIIVQFQGQLGSEAIAAHQVNAEANIQLSINGTPPAEINAGGSVEYELTVTNAGPLVANMQLQLQGVPTAWVQIIPPVINLNEGRRGSFLVRISPPRDSSAEAGVYNIHFVATSPNYPRETATADTALNVLPYTEFMLNGPMPRVLKLSRRKPSQPADLVVINNSNSTSNFMVQTYDDANELQFTYERGGVGMYQNQEIVSVRAGDHVRVPIMVTSKKIPFVAFSSHVRHYSVNVTPSDRPGDTQSVIGEVNVRPFIRTYVLLLLVALAAILGLFVLQPYIRQFDGADGKRTQVVLAGSSAQINWRVSPLASKVTMDDGNGPQEVAKNGSMYVSPSSSTTYVLRSENILSRFLGFEHTKSLQVLSIPNRPKINLFTTDAAEALFNQTVTFSWAVEPNADKATIMINKQAGELPPEQYSASQQETLTSDTLAAIKAENSSGYEMKSIFVSVSPDVIDLLRYAVWVRPNGIAVPNDNDTRKQTRWGSLQLTTDTSNTLKPALSNPQPAAQSNTLEIPDNFNNTAGTVQSYNPEQLSLNGQAIQPTPYSYTPPVQGAPSTELLVGPSVTRERTDRNPSDSSGLDISSVMHQDYAPVTSPEGTGNGFDPNFTIKLMEVIEDPMSESGYRVIDYFPDYQLQPGEQILVEWNVDGVAKVKIDNLSDDLKNSGAEYANPEKPVTYVLHAQVGDVEQAYSLPVRVAGDADNGEGSGLNCELKANATTLKVPGTVMLTWKGGGNGRVQIVSSAKAEADSADAEKKKEAEAKEKGENYEKPTQPQALEGGVIADYLQPSGFMRVNVDKQTIFMLNCYDSSNNVICTKSVEVKYEGGNDKADLKLEIVSVTDSQGVERPVYTVGQTVQYTVRVSGFDAKKVPSGNVTISDSVSSCSVTLPTVTCSVQAKKTGKLVLTAVYSGDDNYNKATAYGTETVIDKLTSTMDIQTALKPAADRVNMITQLKYDAENEYGLVPSGTITFTAGSGTCDLDVLKDTLTCDGKVVEMDNDPYWFKITDMLLADAAADRITAAYKGDDYFSPSTSTATLFQKISTVTSVKDDPKPYKDDSTHADFNTVLGWDWGDWLENGESISESDDLIAALLRYRSGGTDEKPEYSYITPSGTLTFSSLNSEGQETGVCHYDIKAKKLDCEGIEVDIKDNSLGKKPDINEEFILRHLQVSSDSDRIKVSYSGDSLFNSSASSTYIFETLPTKLTLSDAVKPASNLADVVALLTYDTEKARGLEPKGTITFTVGSGTCVLTITDPENLTLSCNGDAVKTVDKDEYTISDMLLIDTAATTIKAEYSGDGFFLPSASDTISFEILPTKLTLSDASKPASNLADVVALLTYDTEKDHGLSPKGTITFTVGSGTCVLTITDPKDLKLSCNGEAVKTENIQEYRLTNMLLTDTSATTIKAEYSGDGFFMPSASDTITFFNIDTESVITTAFKTDESHVTVVSELTWDPEENDNDYEPSGSITYTVGTGTCVLEFKDVNDPETWKLSCENERFTIDSDEISEGKLIFKTVGMQVTDKAADRVIAAYSGDSHFNPSTSKEFLFRKVNTITKILEAYKPSASIANIITSLTRNEGDWNDIGCNDEGMSCPDMTGTLTFTVINPYNQDSKGKTETKCTLDIVKKTMDCTGTVNVEGDEYHVLNMLLEDQLADRVKIDYSGDAFYYASTAAETLFNRVLTETVITNAEKKTISDKKYTNFTVDLTWMDKPLNDATPTGTITFTAGNFTCDLDVESGKLGCEGKVAQYGSRFVIEGMALGDEDPSSIQAEYSGDSAFHPSLSQPWVFDTIDTVIEIVKAFKPDDTMVNLVSSLTCIESYVGDCNPTGTITFIASNSMVDTITCKHKLGTNKDDPDYFSCQGTLNHPEENEYELTIENMPIGQITADRIRAVYSGDGKFNPSTSKMVMFKTVGTAINIKDASKTADNVVSMTTVLNWDEFVSGGVRPSGTIKYTSGTRTCTLDISGDPFKFTDCDSREVVFTYSESDRKLNITINGLGMTGAGGTIKAEYSGSGAYLKSESPEVNFGKIGTELDIDDSKTYKTDTSHVNVEADLKWKKEDAGEQNPSGTVTFTIGSTACTLNITANTLSGCEAAKFNVTGPEDDPEDPAFRKYHLTLGDVLFEGTADRVKAEYSGDAAFNPSSSTSLFKTVPTEITITNEDPNKPYRPNAGYANFNTILTWDEEQAAGRTPGGTITFTPVNSTACVYTLSTGKMDCEGKVTYVTDHYEIRNLLMSNSNSDRIQAKYSGDGFFEESTSTTVLFDMSDTATKIMNAAKSPENVVDMNVSVTSTKPHPDGRQPVGTIVFTSGTKTCTLDISGSPARFTDCEGTVVYNADNNYYEINGLVMGDTSGESIFAKYSGDSFFKESTSPTVDFTKVDTELEISKAYKPGSQNLLDLVVALSWDKTKAENKAPTGTIQFTIGSDTCVLSKLETDEPGFNCKGENTKITREKSEPGDSDTWSYTWTIANILLTNNTADRVKAEYKGDAIFNPSSSDTVLFKTVPTEIAVSSAFKTGTDHADITAALSWDNGLAEGRVPTGTIKFTAGSGSCTLDIETKALSCEPKTGTVSDDRKTYSVIGMLLDDKTADRVSVEYSGDGFFEPSVSSKVLFQTIPTDLMISNAKLTPPGFIRLTAELSWIDTPPVGKTPGGTIKFTSGTGTCTLDISASPVKFTDCDGRVERTVSEDGKKQTYTIINMFFGGKAGTDVKAEYSGDGLFLASASDKLAFDKLDTTLVISDAYKPEVSLTNSTVTLSWLEEEAGGNKPSGTVKLTIGGSTCTLNMADDSFSCSGESTKITRSEGETVSDAKTYAYIRWVFENVLLSDEKADRIKAEYSGDTFFNDSSSVTVLFKTIPTDLTITNGDKKSSGLIDLTMDLSWTDTPPANVLPDGTIKLTSGSSTCTVSLSGDTARLTDCQGNSPVVTVSADRKKLTISMTGLNMGEKTGDGVKAEYSGNSIFLASASDSLFFNKINTTLTIDPNEVYKSGEGLLNMISKLSWDAEKAGGKLPTGTITYTIGSDSCVLDIETKAFTCSGTDTDIQRTDADGSFEWAFKNILLSNNTADRVKAVYSGDGAFNTSSSITVLFKTVETTLNIYDQSKAFSRVNMTVALGWVDAAPKDKKPAGTIKLIAGSSSCSMDMGADPLKLDCDANASVTLLPPDPDDPQKVSYRIENFTYFGAGVESIKAQYSGDGCFLPSESNTIAFNKKDTKLTIDSSAISKPDELTANLNVTLSSDDVQADVDEMTGTIKFTIGSDTCTYDITAQTFSCSGETTKITEVKDPENRKITWTFENVVLSSGNNADRVKADYSGNDGYNPSTSPIVFFTKVNTSLAIPSATKSNAGLITMTGEFSWIETPPAGKIPGGTIKFVSGTAVCTLDINADPLKFSDCPGTVTVNKDEENKKYTYTVTDMNMGDKVGDEIKLEYSGDGTFQPSSSDPYSFIKVDTKLVINANETFRTNDLTATVLASLTWTKADADGKTPTGTVKFTIGPDVCTLDIVSEEFNCYGAATIIKIQDIPTEAADPETGKSLSIKEIMLSTGNNADRVKAEYNGDAIFNPSASSTVLFKTIETELDIHDQKKLPTDLVKLATDLTWEDTPPEGKTPAGTIKYTSGNASCTLNLASKKFTDCEGTVEITFNDGIATVQVTNLNMGVGIGNTIKAEYSGDGCFLASVSVEEELVYTKVDTNTNIKDLAKTTAGIIDMTITVHPEEVRPDGLDPMGTIKITTGSKTCTLDITSDPPKISDPDNCQAAGIVKSGESYKITGLNMGSGIGTGIKAEYSGDSYFNKSTSPTVDFLKLDTFLFVDRAVKSSSTTADFTITLFWDTDESVKEAPTGTIKLTIGSDTCNMDIAAKTISCSTSTTYIEEDSSLQYGYYFWNLYDVLLSNGNNADRVKAEYSGDATFNPSVSDTEMFTTVPTKLAITLAEKPDADHATLNADLTWEESANVEGRTPTGSVKFTAGSGSCTLTLSTKALSCEQGGVTVSGSEAGKLHMEILSMLLDDKTADRVSAEYSGDGYFVASTSTKVIFKKYDVTLEITQITDESGKEHGYFIPEQKVRIVTNLAGAQESPAPTGTITVSIDTATCTMTLPQNTCDITLPKLTGDIPVKAVYGGDNSYNGSNAESSVTIKEKQPLTLEIVNIIDSQGVEHGKEDNVYGRGQKVTVTLGISGHDPLEIPTGDITVKVGTTGTPVDCEENWPDTATCKLTMPADPGTYDLTAEYGGNTYYEKAVADPWKIIVDKSDITFKIDSISNGIRAGEDTYIRQSYYVYTWTGADTGTGQNVQVCIKFEDFDPAVLPDYSKVQIKDKNRDNLNPLIQFTAGQQCGTFNTEVYKNYLHDMELNEPITVTLVAEFTGDANYMAKKVEEPTYVYNRISPKFELLHTYTFYDDQSKGTITFELSPDTDIPERYDRYGDVILSQDKTTDASEPHVFVRFDFRNVKYVFDLATSKLYDVTTGLPNPLDIVLTKTGNVYILDNVPFPAGNEGDPITAKYDGNRYFYDKESSGTIVTEPGGFTRVELADVLKINNPAENKNIGHMFLKADLYYDTNKSRTHDGALPVGHLEIKTDKDGLGSTPRTCTFTVSQEQTVGIVKCGESESSGTATLQGNHIHFEIRDLDVQKNAGRVEVQFITEDLLFESSAAAEEDITTEDRPAIQFSENGAEKITNTTANLEFRVKDMGSLTRAYGVYNQIEIGSGYDNASNEKVIRDTCIMLHGSDTYSWKDDKCSGEITRTESSSGGLYTYVYKISNFSGIIKYDPDNDAVDTRAFLKLRNDFGDITDAEFPTDSTPYWHKKVPVTLAVRDVLKYMEKKAFLTLDINYDDSQPESFDKYPRGTIELEYSYEGIDVPKQCYIYWDEEDADPHRVCEGARLAHSVPLGDQWIVNVDVESLPGMPEYSRIRLRMLADDYYEESPWTDYAGFTKESPEIEIRNAWHTGAANEVFTDFTITGMGTLSEKYLVNKEIRLTSKAGGKTCTYDLINRGFNEDTCQGTITVSGTTYTIKNLAGLYTANDSELSIAVTSDYLEEAEFAHKEKAYGKLDTGIVISDTLKVKPFSANDTHAFLTVDFRYDAEVGGRYGVEPSGTLTFSATGGSCTYNLRTKTASGCVVEPVESASSDGLLHLLVKNLIVAGNATVVNVSYADDAYFAEKDESRGFDHEAHPNIHIMDAIKTTSTKADVTLVVTDPEILANVYGSFFRQIRIGSNGTRFSYINIGNIMTGGGTSGTASIINGNGTVTWTKESAGYYTFEIKNWTGPIAATDWTCYAALVSSYLEESEYPHDECEFEHRTSGPVTMSVSDVYAAQVKHIYLTAVMDYDPDIAVSYNELPTGTLTINADGGSVKTCAFDLKANPATFDCGTVELDSTGHKATFVFRNYEVPGSVAQVSVKYNGDTYFNASDENSGPVITADPEITIEYPIKTRESDYSAHGYVAFTINGIGEGSYPEMYNIYPRIRLISRDSSNRRYCYFDRTTLSFTDNCEADEITLSGNQYIFKNLRGKVGGTNFIQSNDDYIIVALYPYGEGWTGETYSSDPMKEVYWWNRISISGAMTDVIKYSRDHAAFTTTLSLSETGQRGADFWGMSPAMAAGTMEFKAGSVTCTVDLATETFTGCEGEVEVTGNAPVTIKVRKLQATDLGPSLLIAEYHPNRFFDHWQQQYVTFRENIPAVTIDSATKTAHTKANVTVTVSGNDYAEIYGPLYDRIRLAAHNGAYTEIDISGILAGSETSGTIPGTSGFESVNWTRDGYNVTFNVTGWKENITADDKQCTAWLGNSDVSVLPIDHSPKSDPKDFDFAKGSITLTKKNDGLRAINDNAYLDVVLDYDPDTAAAFRKPYGKVTFMAEDSAQHKWIKTCTYDLNYIGDLVCDGGGSGSATVIEKDDANHNATIRLKSFHIYNADSIYVFTADDNFYTDANRNIPVTREIPTITVSAPVKRTDSRGYTKGWVEFTIKSGPLTEYYQPYSRIDLHSIPSSGTDAVVGINFPGSPSFDDTLVTGTIDFQHDADTYTYSYVIKNLAGLVRSNDARMRADLCSDAAGAVQSNESGFVKISSTINLQDLLVVVDANQKNYAFGKMVYRFADFAKIYDLWPAYYMNVRGNWPGGVRFGHIDVETGALGTDARNSFGNAVFTPERAEDTHTLQITMVDVNVHEDTSQVAVYYNDGSNGYPVDDVFQESTTGSVNPTVVTPGVSITKAFKHPLSVGGSIVPAADISFTLTGYDDLLDKWGVYKSIELRSKNGNTSGVCQIDLPWDSEHPSMTCSGTITKEGNTFSIKDWRGLTSSSDSSVEVALVSKYSDIAGARNEKDYEKTGLEVRISDALLMDSKYRFMKITLTPEDPEYSFALSDVRIASGETCKYNVSTGENTCGCRIEKTESGGSVQLSVEGWERTGSGLSYVYQVTYLEDDYFYYAAARQSCDTVSLPTVEINNIDVANKTIDIRIDRYTDYFSKYSIIDAVVMRSLGTLYSSATNFVPSQVPDGQTIPGLDGMMITRNGDQFHVSNHPYMSSRYRSMKVYLDSVPYDTGSGNRWYWPDESIYAEVPLTSGFTSPAPSNSGASVSISVGDLQPIGGQ